jgi:hypothetical protein
VSDTKNSTMPEAENPQTSIVPEKISRSTKKAKSTVSHKTKTKAGRNDTEIRLRAIQILTNLPEEGQFFLTAINDGEPEVICNWG